MSILQTPAEYAQLLRNTYGDMPIRSWLAIMVEAGRAHPQVPTYFFADVFVELTKEE